MLIFCMQTIGAKQNNRYNEEEKVLSRVILYIFFISFRRQTMFQENCGEKQPIECLFKGLKYYCIGSVNETVTIGIYFWIPLTYKL